MTTTFQIRGEHTIPERRGYTVVAGLGVIVVRHVSDARLVEQGPWPGLRMMGEMVHQHVADIAQQHAACEAACRYQADREEGSEEDSEDDSDAEERGGADQRARIQVMCIMEFLEERDAMIDPSVNDIFDKRPGAETCPESEYPQSRGFDVPTREGHDGEHKDGDRTHNEIAKIENVAEFHLSPDVSSFWEGPAPGPLVAVWLR
jgi:hypothetical protein